MEKLKPCPFCGGKADFHEYEISPIFWLIRFRCFRCAAEITLHGVTDKNSKDIQKDMLKAWNTSVNEAKNVEEEEHGET